MNTRFSGVVLMCLCALPMSGVASDVDGGTDDPNDAHKALREAVEEIRVHYAPMVRTYGDIDFRSDMSRPGLGIIVRGGGWTAGDFMEGAVIIAVTPGSPAAEFGLEPGDVVTRWNDEPLSTATESPGGVGVDASRELVARSRKLEEGDTVTLGYSRDGEERLATLVARVVDFSPQMVGEIAGQSDFIFRSAPVLAGKSAGSWHMPMAWLDMELASLNPDLGEYFGTDSGVLVVRGPEGDETLGLESGDVILEIGDREVKSPEHAMRILRSYEPDEKLTVLIIRHKRTQTLAGTVPETSFHFDYRTRWSGEDD